MLQANDLPSLALTVKRPQTPICHGGKLVEFMTGRTSYYINDDLVSEDTFRKVSFYVQVAYDSCGGDDNAET